MRVAVWLPELDAVFLHIPKAGGTWVKAALAASGLRCEPAGGAGDHQLPDAYRKAGKRFAFVRHPLTWLESAWRGLHGSWPNRRDVPPLHRERTWSPIRNLTYLAGDADFNGFVETLLANQPGFVTRMYEAYIGPPGYPRVDWVGRKESLGADLQTILTGLGWRGSLAIVPPANEGPPGPAPVWHPVLQSRFLAAERPSVLRWYQESGPFEVTT